jgi:hypothetical protein
MNISSVLSPVSLLFPQTYDVGSADIGRPTSSAAKPPEWTPPSDGVDLPPRCLADDFLPRAAGHEGGDVNVAGGYTTMGVGLHIWIK